MITAPERLEGDRIAPPALPASPLPIYRRRLAEGREALRQRHAMGTAVDELVHDTARLIDDTLIALWREYALPEQQLALAAVGGYGRGELHPGSDVDIAIILDAQPEETVRRRIEQFVTLLWDIGLEVAHSVRTVEQCRDVAAADITVATSLMEARLLVGDVRLFQAMRAATGPDSIWPTPQFLEAKLNEQLTRHRKFHNTAQNLEPNIKEGPGGLRDIQSIGWVAKRHFGAETLRGLLEHDFLTEEEYKTLRAGQSLLWRIRYELHQLTGRREDRLLFDHQRAVAAAFGFHDPDGNRGIEQFMKLYYRTVLELRRLNEMLLEIFEEVISQHGRQASIQPLSSRFQIRNGYIEVVNDYIFKRYPFALLELFVLLQQNPDIQGVRASTIRLIRDHRYLIDETFRSDLRNRSLFMEILRQPRRIGHELARMHRYGVLEAYLPVFGAVVGLMQFDLFHVYTVDEHTLFVVRNLRRFSFPEREDELPLCREIVAQLPKPELLYIAGLFHDIAKGRGGDHSELGEQEAQSFCRQHGLSEFDSTLVGWLVRHHLLMSRTATRMDVTDPMVINDFAGLCGDRLHLDYLYLLTVADIRGTNPALWTSWKDSLLRELYRGTLHALRRGLENPVQRPERIGTTQGAAMALLLKMNLDQAAVRELWNSLAEDYFLRHTPEEIAWHAQVIQAHGARSEPLVLLREQTARGGSEIFLYSRDQDHLFAVVTQTLDELGLTIHDARVITSRRGYTLDTYAVLDADSGQTIEDRERAEAIVVTLRARLSAPGLPEATRRRSSRKLRAFSIPTTVRFSEDSASQRTMMEVVTTDRPGLLARIARAMRWCQVRLKNARIATFGERVEDIFFLTDMDNRPLSDPVKFECLRRSITEALAAD